MRWLKHRWRAIARTIAIFLLLSSAYTAFWWFYQLGPNKHTLDSDWLAQHSREAYWEEIQTSLRRIGWTHWAGWPAGWYGDADFMAWAMSQTRPEDSGLNDCSAGHRASSFCKITNQDLGTEGKGWLQWWAENKSKSQIEWIQDGFAKYDVKVSVPPSDADIIPLLQLLGNMNEQEGKNGRNVQEIPDFIKYNAFRWLRDSDFNPIQFMLSDESATLDPIAKEGLLQYYQYERRFPSQEAIGQLYFNGNSHSEDDDSMMPTLLTLHFRMKIYAKIVIPLLLGIGLIVWTFRKPRKTETKLDENLQPTTD